MTTLVALPHEILHSILLEINAVDLATLSQTCRLFANYIYNNRLLCKAHFLKTWDDPQQHRNEPEPDWEDELHQAVFLQNVLKSEDQAKKRDLLLSVTDVISHLLTKASPARLPSKTASFLTDSFSREHNIDALLCSSSLFDRITLQARSETTIAQRQASAKLHCLYGVPIDQHKRRKDQQPTHPYARAKVYDLRTYTDAAMWGPFTDDGTMFVDWEKTEAIMIVLGYNLRSFSERTSGAFPMLWLNPWGGVTPHSFVSPPLKSPRLEPRPPVELQDPYGITGYWMRVVCFLDYTDLFAYNFTSEVDSTLPRPPLETEEAIRLITMTLYASKIEAPGPDDGQDLPVVHFVGRSRSMHAGWDPNANSSIRGTKGTVRLTPEGEIRWTTFSVFNGDERWRSEGIQVGGIRSTRGVLGSWFDKDYDVEGPAGPTAFWKLQDHISEDNDCKTMDE